MNKFCIACFLGVVWLCITSISYAAPSSATSSPKSAAKRPYIELPQVPEPYGRRLCTRSGFHCIDVAQGATWYSLFPIQWQRLIVMRLNRTNVALQYRKWLVVPNSWAHFDYLAASPFPDHIKPPGRKEFLVNLKVFAFAAYNAAGYLVYWGPATGGRQWCDNAHKESCLSAEGSYSIYRMQGADCVSSQYDRFDNPSPDGGASMPYCMHYYRGYAIHGSTLEGFFNHSHGCIRLFDDDAKWVNQQFVTLGTKVVVKR